MVKNVKILLASIFAMLAFSNAQASALSFVSLDKTSEDSEFIEFNTPSEGYHFDISFLASEQTLEYKATIKNDEDYNIKINSISLAGPEHDFIEFSYDGISEGSQADAGRFFWCLGTRNALKFLSFRENGPAMTKNAI